MDDHPVLIEGLKSLLLNNMNVDIAGCFVTGEGVLAYLEALDGDIVFSREVKEIISRPSANELEGLPQLTRREKQIIKLIAEGKTSVKIADELSVSSLTIDTHRRNLMQKFGVKNTAELIKAAMLQQLL